MNEKDLKEQIISLVSQIDDEKVLQDIKNIINAIYKHYSSGNWER